MPQDNADQNKDPRKLKPNPATSVDPSTMAPLRAPAVLPERDIEEDDDEDEDEDGDESEPQVIKEVIIKEKGGSGGCFSFLSNLACFALIIILALIVAAVAIIIFQPAFITEPLKTFINGPYGSEQSKNVETPAMVEDYVQEITEDLKDGEVTFQISEAQTASLLEARVEGGMSVRTEIEEDRFIVLTNISKQGKPLWVVTELTDENGRLELTRLGLGRINSPKFLRSFLKDRVLKIFGSFSEDLKVENGEELSNSLINNYLDENLKIDKVKFKKDVILVTVTFN